MRLALAQINPTVGDLDGNSDLIVEYSKRAAEGNAELVVFPELALCGYPPRDLIELPVFIEKTAEALEAVAARTANLGVDLIVGYVGSAEGLCERRAANCAAVLSGGQITFVQQKALLPTYDVFDEWRYFAPAESQSVITIRGERIGITICEDVWNDKSFWDRPRYPDDPIKSLADQGMDLIVNIACSPYYIRKRDLRERMLQAVAGRLSIPVAMVNQVGGNDELIFDGSSFVAGREGSTIARAASFKQDLLLCDLDAAHEDLRHTSHESDAAYDALVLGTRDYLRKCGFSQAVIGLSGGVDSSLTAAIAVEALGAENVIGVGMPGPYSSEGSVSDARELAEQLGARFELLSINHAYQAALATIKPAFRGFAPDVTEENLQARLRGLTLMALANKFNAITLTTGNKSELAVGYCTLYGDMAGGLAVISDVPKTMVYELSRVANRRRPGAIPETVFSKPPSAELRPDQKDTDSLPEYDQLDPILELYLEEQLAPEQITERLSTDADLVRKICRMVDRNEYKRRQAAPGLRITSKAFGIGRRFPVAQRFRP